MRPSDSITSEESGPNLVVEFRRVSATTSIKIPKQIAKPPTIVVVVIPAGVDRGSGEVVFLLFLLASRSSGRSSGSVVVGETDALLWSALVGLSAFREATPRNNAIQKPMRLTIRDILVDSLVANDC